MGDTQTGFYHPEYDEALKDARNRLLLGRRLKELADAHNQSGDALLLTRDWDGADLHWRVGAQCMRASQAISFAKPTNRTDWLLIEAAWLDIRAGKKAQR